MQLIRPSFIAGVLLKLLALLGLATRSLQPLREPDASGRSARSSCLAVSV